MPVRSLGARETQSTDFFLWSTDRIAEQKIQVKTLVVLYAHSSNIPGRNDTLRDDKDSSRGIGSVNPKRALKNLLKGVRGVAEGATTALGNVASEITGSSTLQPSSPEAKVYTALSSANKTRLVSIRSEQTTSSLFSLD